LAEFRPDAILVEADPISWLSVSLARWARKHGAKCLCLSVDNLDFGVLPHLRRTGIGSLPQIIVKNALHVAACRLVDVVFTISADGTAIFRKRGYRKVVQVPLGFDPTLFRLDPEARARTRRRLGIPDEAIVFGYFGRIVPEKGVHLIIEALARLNDAQSGKRDWRLLLDKFDPNTYTQQIDDMIERTGVAQRTIRFEASHDEIADFMRATDVLLLASLTTRKMVEQYGRVVPEAMACGVLAIVSDSGAPKELVGDCGVVLPEGNVDQLVAAISAVLHDNEQYGGMRASSVDRAKSHYTVQRRADIYHETLRGLSP
jgi:glycosyltransferase involved in cell wall biosynthesis